MACLAHVKKKKKDSHMCRMSVQNVTAKAPSPTSVADDSKAVDGFEFWVTKCVEENHVAPYHIVVLDVKGGDMPKSKVAA